MLDLLQYSIFLDGPRRCVVQIDIQTFKHERCKYVINNQNEFTLHYSIHC